MWKLGKSKILRKYCKILKFLQILVQKWKEHPQKPQVTRKNEPNRLRNGEVREILNFENFCKILKFLQILVQIWKGHPQKPQVTRKNEPNWLRNVEVRKIQNFDKIL